MADTKPCKLCGTLLDGHDGYYEVGGILHMVHLPHRCRDVLHAQLTAERAKVEEARKALWSARKELENYVKDDMGYNNSSVVDCIEEVDAALEKLRGQ